MKIDDLNLNKDYDYSLQERSELLKKIDDIDIFIYDFEVYKYDWMVTFKRLRDKKFFFFHNDKEKLSDFLAKYIRNKNVFLVGYNNANYDTYILRAILLNIDPYLVSNWIINDKQAGWLFPQFKGVYFDTNSIIEADAINIVSTDRKPLKMHQAYLGFLVKESNIAWDIDRALTKQEIDETFIYNVSDVNTTEHIFIKYFVNFQSKLSLITNYKIPFRYLRKTNTQIIEQITKADKFLVPYEPFIKYRIPQELRNLVLKTKYGKEVIEKFENYKYGENDDTNSFTIKMEDLTYFFSEGGGHAAIENHICLNADVIVQIDFSSFYNAIMLKYHYFSRASHLMPSLINNIFHKRLEYKKTGQKLKAAADKIILVSSYGIMKAPFSKLYDQRQALSICITGQVILYLFMAYLEKYCTIEQANTDGIDIHIKGANARQIWNKITQIEAFFKNTLNFNLEHSFYKYRWQKDVNNYILVKDKNNIDTYKLKGSLVRFYKSQYHKKDFVQIMGSNTIINNSLTIIDKAVVDFFVHNIDPMITLKNEKELIRFQYIFELRGKYKYCYLGDKNLGSKKVWRVFFVKSGNPIYKCYEKDNLLKKDKVPNTSTSSIVYNDEVLNKDSSLLDLDYEYYEKLCYDAINLYLGDKSPYLNKGNVEVKKRTYNGNYDSCQICSTSLLRNRIVRILFDKELCLNCFNKYKNLAKERMK